MKQIFLFLISFSFAFSQQNATLSGYIKDRSNKETLPFANVLIKELKIGAASNIEGYFAVPNIPPGQYTVVISLLGYRNAEFSINTEKEKRIVKEIFLDEQYVQVNEVIISAEMEEEKRSTQTSRIVMQAKDIATLPTIGEADLFRALQLMPGVKAVSEISSGLSVRGGSTDQNLILLDGTVVYNPSHLFGFFSTFNNDAIKDIDLMKGGFPAEYGGRLSSVLNVTNIDGDRVKTHGKASVSLLSTRVTGEGPLGNGSWFLSGRRTYLDQVVSIAKLDTGKDALPLYYFYDANVKINQDLSENDKISLVGYFGRDDLLWKIENGALTLKLNWGNTTGAVKWTHIFDQTLFSDFIFSYSKYNARTEFNIGGFSAGQDNGVIDYSLKGDLDYFYSNEHLIKFGIWWSQYEVTYSQSGDGDPYVFKERPAQISIYGQDEWIIDERWITQFGLRFEYQDLTKKFNIGPRFNVRYNLDENSMIKFASGLYYQFLNAVPAGTDNGASPFDIWIPINEKMVPSRSIDFVLGYENHLTDEWHLSLEGYYKKFYDLLNFKREFTRTLDVSELFYTGDGTSYGIEAYLQKQIGSITGSFAYTLSRTLRQFPALNGGKEFEPKYDRRHDLTFTASYDFGENWKLTAVYNYATGQTYTMGAGRYQQNILGRSYDFVIIQDIYNRRLSPYHRLDLSITKYTTWFDLPASWYFQIYNVYNHRNVWFKQFDNSKNPIEITDVTLLPLIPTFGFDIKF